ncbi:MAG: hypothetical protein O2917_00660 [Acidobacteria bacterium]|nr:hypothetical protein [Acidobacteriota bacterium]
MIKKADEKNMLGICRPCARLNRKRASDRPVRRVGGA